MAKMAILIDGGFYRVRNRMFRISSSKSPQDEASAMMDYCEKHIAKSKEESGKEHYRTFYYDCPPVEATVYNPLSKMKEDISKSPTYVHIKSFLKELTTKDNLALRMGRLGAGHVKYVLKPQAEQALLEGRKTLTQLTRMDLKLDMGQKGVDMRLGLDLVSLALKRLVDQVIIITGDSDFVPAIKLARTEGVEVILDPMKQHIADDLQEHIDRTRTFC